MTNEPKQYCENEREAIQLSTTDDNSNEFEENHTSIKTIIEHVYSADESHISSNTSNSKKKILCKTQDQEKDEVKAIKDICSFVGEKDITKVAPTKVICKTQDVHNDDDDEIEQINHIWNIDDNKLKYTLSEEEKIVEGVWKDDDDIKAVDDYDCIVTESSTNIIDGIPEHLTRKEDQKEIKKKQQLLRNQQLFSHRQSFIEKTGSSITTMSTIQKRLTLACVNSIAFEIVLSEELVPLLEGCDDNEDDDDRTVSSIHSAPGVMVSSSQEDEFHQLEQKYEEKLEVNNENFDENQKEGNCISDEEEDVQKSTTMSHTSEQERTQEKAADKGSNINNDNELEDLNSDADFTSFTLSLSSSSEAQGGLSGMTTPQSTSAFQMVKDLALQNNNKLPTAFDTKMEQKNTIRKIKPTKKDYEEVYPYSFDDNEEDNDENIQSSFIDDSYFNNSNSIKRKEDLTLSEDNALQTRDDIITTNTNDTSVTNMDKFNKLKSNVDGMKYFHLADYIKSKQNQYQHEQKEEDALRTDTTDAVPHPQLATCPMSITEVESIIPSTIEPIEEQHSIANDVVIKNDNNASTSLQQIKNTERTNSSDNHSKTLMKLISETKSRLARSQQECKLRNKEMSRTLEELASSTSIDNTSMNEVTLTAATNIDGSTNEISQLVVAPKCNPTDSTKQSLLQKSPEKNQGSSEQFPTTSDNINETNNINDASSSRNNSPTDVNENLPFLLRKKALAVKEETQRQQGSNEQSPTTSDNIKETVTTNSISTPSTNNSSTDANDNLPILLQIKALQRHEEQQKQNQHQSFKEYHQYPTMINDLNNNETNSSGTTSTNENLPTLLRKKNKEEKKEKKSISLSLFTQEHNNNNVTTAPKLFTFSNATTPISGICRPEDAIRGGGSIMDSTSNIRSRLQSSLFPRRSTKNNQNNASKHQIATIKKHVEVNNNDIVDTTKPADIGITTTVSESKVDEQVSTADADVEPMNVLQEQEEQQPRIYDTTLHRSSMTSVKPTLFSSSRPCAASNTLTSSCTNINDRGDAGSDVGTDVSNNTAFLCTLASETAKRLAGEEDTCGRIQINTLASKEERDRHMMMANLIGKLSKGPISLKK